MTDRSDTRAVGSYDPYWAWLWQAWMTVLERGGIVSLVDGKD